MINLSRLNPGLAAQHSRRNRLAEKRARESETWLAERNNAQNSWVDEFLTTKRKTGEEFRFWFPEDHPEPGPTTPIPAAHNHPGEPDQREPSFPAGPSYQRLNADRPDPETTTPKFRQINSVETGPNRVETYWLDIRPGRKSPTAKKVGCRSSDLSKGRQDPSVKIQGAEVTAPAVIDCHKQPRAQSAVIEKLLQDHKNKN